MIQDWIYKLNESNSRLHKEDIIKQCLSAAILGSIDARYFLTLVWYAYNPYEVFNIKKVPTTCNITNDTNDIPSFISFLKKIKMREITGNAAFSELQRVGMQYDSDLWNNLLAPVLQKDLRVGATVKTFNKILKGTDWEIPVFECQLASDSAKHPGKLTGKKLLEPKLDGIRALAFIEKDYFGTKVAIYSRNGKPLTNFPHIEADLVECLKIFETGKPFSDYRFRQYVIDGEIVSKSFQSLMKQAQRKTDIDTSDSIYSIFDIVPSSYFVLGKWNMSQKNRSVEWLGSLRDKVNSTCTSLNIIKGIEVDLSTNEGQDIMRRYGTDQVNKGYEGIMIKDIGAPYQCKRGTNWMKWKPFLTIDLKIIDMEEGTGRNKDRLGALVCEGNEDGKVIKVNVGSGITDDERDDFWARKDELIGFIAEVKADVITQNQDGSYSLRFPRFVRFRGFEVGEKI